MLKPTRFRTTSESNYEPRPVETRAFLAKDYNKMLEYKERYNGVVIRHSMKYGVIYEVKIPPTCALVQIHSLSCPTHQVFMSTLALANMLHRDKLEFFTIFMSSPLFKHNVTFKTINYYE